MDIRQEILLKRDKYATLACVALAALEQPYEEGDWVNFPDLCPKLRDATNAIMEALYCDGTINAEESACSYIEPGCLEHGVIHVHVCDAGYTSAKWRWLEIDPMTGLVERL